MTSSRQVGPVLVAAIVGGIAGTAASVNAASCRGDAEQLSHLSEPEQVPQVPRIATPEQLLSQGVREDDDDSRLAALERGLDELQAEGFRSSTSELLPQPTPEETHETLALHQDALEAHADEPFDSEWASSTAQSIRDESLSLEERGGFSVVDVACRSKSCVVTMEWPSREEAVETYASMVHHNFEINCAHSIVLSEDASLPFQAQMLMICRQQ